MVGKAYVILAALTSASASGKESVCEKSEVSLNKDNILLQAALQHQSSLSKAHSSRDATKLRHSTSSEATRGSEPTGCVYLTSGDPSFKIHGEATCDLKDAANNEYSYYYYDEAGAKGDKRKDRKTKDRRKQPVTPSARTALLEDTGGPQGSACRRRRHCNGCVAVMGPPPCAGETGPPAPGDAPGWNNGAGKDCSDYAKNGWCKDGDFMPGQESQGGSKYKFPEQNCKVCGRRNLAKGKLATASSLGYGATVAGVTDGRTNAGRFDGETCMHTNNQPSWIKVDLGAPAPIKSVGLVGRSDCCPDQSRKWTIRIGNVGDQTDAVCLSNVDVAGTIFPKMLSCSTMLIGRYISVWSARWMVLCELEAYGPAKDREFQKLQPGKYCPRGTGVSTQAACEAAAADLGFRFRGIFNGGGSHKDCSLKDGSVLFNTAGKHSASVPVDKQFASICKLKADKIEDQPEPKRLCACKSGSDLGVGKTATPTPAPSDTSAPVKNNEQEDMQQSLKDLKEEVGVMRTQIDGLLNKKGEAGLLDAVKPKRKVKRDVRPGQEVNAVAGQGFFELEAGVSCTIACKKDDTICDLEALKDAASNDAKCEAAVESVSKSAADGSYTYIYYE